MININAYARLARFDKLAGAWLLLLPCWWGLAFGGYRNLNYYILFAIGAVIMRGAGCVINDIADRKFDAQVERTKHRPLASGEISLSGALVFLALLLLLGLVVLLQLTKLAIIIGLCSVPLFITYPFMKRITYWPQIFLGITFNIGILIGYAMTHESLSPASIILYVAGVFWTLGYDTIYAHQDKADDLKIGVKSTALKLGRWTKPIVTLFYISFITLAFYASQMDGRNGITAVILGIAGVHLLWQVVRLDIDNPQSCMRVFKSNIYTGLIVFVALLAINLFSNFR